MIECTAVEAAIRLEQLQISKVISSAKNCTFKLVQIRQLPINSEISELEKEKICRLAELISISLDIPYEIESLLLISEINVISGLFRSIRNSIKLLNALDDTIIKCEETDTDFYNQFAVFEGGL